MSGGYFNYKEHALLDLAEELLELSKADNEMLKLQKSKDLAAHCAQQLQELYDAIHGLDYVLESDISEDDMWNEFADNGKIDDGNNSNNDAGSCNSALDRIRDAILNTAMDVQTSYGIVGNYYDVQHGLSVIDNLGDNARMMLEIGVLQDELVRMGFYSEHISEFKYMYKTPKATDNGCIVGERIYFSNTAAKIIGHDGCEFYYTSPTWQQDLLTKIKEIINE